MGLLCKLNRHAWEYGTVHGTPSDLFDNIPTNLRICSRCNRREEKLVELQCGWAKWLPVIPLDARPADR